jgi:hypothetical protein
MLVASPEYREYLSRCYFANRSQVISPASSISRERYAVYQKRAKEKAANLRSIVIQHYGAKCACCGESIPEFLAIDHVNNDGSSHRKKVGVGIQFYKWIIANNYPGTLQLLCHNCNLAKAFYGACPHQVKYALAKVG